MKQIFTVIILFQSIMFCGSSYCQFSKLDSLFAGADTTAVLDSLLTGFDDYLDSLSMPNSFFNISAGVGTGYFSFRDKISVDAGADKKAMFSPQLSYYHKSGLGIALTGFVVKENGRSNPYQLAISPFYDYVKPANYSAGISFTHFFTKQNLSFYTTPINNELYTYFNYKKSWLQPGIAVSYGWGSKTEYDQAEIEILRKRSVSSKKNIIYIKSDESITDLSMLISLRHTFEWHQVLNRKDMVTITPAILLSGGTQNFGLNTSFSSNSTFINNNVLPVNSNIKDTQGLRFQSSAFLLRLNYSIRKFYVSPQLLLDYYLRQSDKRLNSVYSFSVGYILY